MKKRKSPRLIALLSLITCTSLALPALAMDAPLPDTQVSERWAKGTVKTAETRDLFAPISGTLASFDISAGDRLEAEALLFSVDPQQVHAPEGGTVRLLSAQVGEQAQNVVSQYGALCYIDRTDVHWVYASTARAHDKAENRAIVLGETLRVYNGKSNDPISEMGRVIQVNGSDYIVEIPSGVFDLEQDLRLYRGTGDTYKDVDLVGRGKLSRPALLPVQAEGVIADILVEEGDVVARNQALFTVDSLSTTYEEPAETEVYCPEEGIVSALYVQAGQAVQKDQLLMTLAPLSPLELNVEVDELDILSLRVGQTVRVKVDAYNGSGMINAIVSEIDPMGVIVLDTTKYNVTLSLPDAPDNLLPGMHVTAYWE